MFPLDDWGIGQPGEKRFDGIQNDPLCSSRINGIGRVDERSLQVVLARFINFDSLDVYMIYTDETVKDHVIEIKPKVYEILCEIFQGFLESYEDPGFPKILGTQHEKLHCESVFSQPVDLQIIIARHNS